jgi:squalene-hopene/tetraprenyl-beta-curcumene cyclase
MSPGVQLTDGVAACLAQAARRASGRLLALQRPDGCWQGELTADCALETGWLLLQLWLHPPAADGSWTPPGSERIQRAVRSILGRQLPGGGFSVYSQGRADIDASVNAYFALKLAGLHPVDEPMARLRECILALGGLQAANRHVKIYLSLFDLYPRDAVPLAPLMLLQALAAGGRLAPRGFTLEELFKPGVSVRAPRGAAASAGRGLCLGAGLILGSWVRRGPPPLRRRAIRACLGWMLDRSGKQDSPGAFDPAMLHSIMALGLLGYGPDSPERLEAQRVSDRLMVDGGECSTFQPRSSPVWDTALALLALGQTGAAPREHLERAAGWLVARADSASPFYPGTGGTAMVLLALAQARDPGLEGLERAARHGARWLIGRQSKPGGWAAFGADDIWRPLDPACPDTTGSVLEALAAWGLPSSHPAMRAGLRYLLQTQGPDGNWHGRWGVNYIFGTFLALRGLRAAGYSLREAAVLRACEWLRSVQNAGGGWGESGGSYLRQSFVPASSTPSQTAWAILGLIAGGDTSSESVRLGIQYLAATQREDGGWDEDFATGTAIPGGFHFSHHLGRDAYPLLALAEYLKLTSGGGRTTA